MTSEHSKSRAATEAARYTVALEHFPEFASHVGVLISCFALVESYVHRLVSRLIGSSEQDALILTGSFSNFRSRVDLLESLAKRRAPANPDAVIARYFVGRLRAATDLRNRYAHGEFGLTYLDEARTKKVMYISTSLYDANKKSKRLERDLASAERDVASLKLLLCELHGYVHRNEVPDGAEVA